MMTDAIDPERVTITEMAGGQPVHLMYVETWDGLYTPIGVRKPDGEGPFPMVLLASGNGGEGMAWIREAVRNKGYIMYRLMEAGYACAWLRYRTEVELGYNDGGPLVRDKRQGREMFNRSPLEYEDEIAIIEHVKTLPFVDAAVASEPAAHEYLALTPDDTAFVDETTGLRNIEEMRMAEVDKVRGRIDMNVAASRIAGIKTPILVMGRESDHLQGIFRATYELLEEAGKEAEWVSFDHDLHGYVFPVRGEDGEYEVNDVQREAIGGVIAYLERYLKV
jgi:hypothetical protein